MKKLFAIVILGLAGLSMIGCGGGGTSPSVSGKTTVTINIGKTSASAKSISGIPSNIASIKFLISGPDMETIEKVVSISGMTTVSEKFDVPNGLHRHFVLKAMDAAGSVIYVGDAYANLYGVPVHLSIDMTTINLTGAWSADHIEADGSNMGRDCITLTQTGNSLVMAPTYPNDKHTGSGSVNGDQMQITFTTGRVDCGNENTTIVTGIVTGGNTITGTFVVNTGCGNVIHGDWQAVRDDACVPSEIVVGYGDVAGVVKDSTTQTGIGDVLVKVYKEGTSTLVLVSMTDSSGAYLVTLPAGTGYILEFSKMGYQIKTISNIAVTANATTTVETVYLMTGTNTGVGDVSGKILNALTDAGVGAVTVNLRDGSDTRTGPIVANTVADNNGAYRFTDLPEGVYTAEVIGTGYITTYFTVICIAGTTSPNQDAEISPVL